MILKVYFFCLKLNGPTKHVDVNIFSKPLLCLHALFYSGASVLPKACQGPVS